MPSLPAATSSKLYVCSEPGCGKTFGTAGHVRRHERSHSDLQPYPCTRCGKRFARSDVLARHLTALHGRAGGSRQTSRTRDSSQARGPAAPAVNVSSLDAAGGSSRTTNGIDVSPLRAGSVMSSTINTLRPGDTRVGQTHNQTQNAPPPLYMTERGTFGAGGADVSAVGENFFGRGQVQEGMAGTGVINTEFQTLFPPVSQQTYKPNLGPTSPWTAFNEVFGWGLDGADPFESDLSSYGTGFGTDALSAAWLLCSSGGGVGNGGGGVSQNMGFEPLQHQFSGATGAVGLDGGVRSAGMGVGNAVGDGKEKADNPWPHVFLPNAADRPLTISAPAITQRVAPLFNYDLAYVSPTSRNAMLSLIHLSHQAHWSFANINDFPSAETLNSCVNLYFHHFHPTFPVIRPTALREPNAPAVLLLAAAAIGATYAKDDLKSLAVGLNELVRRMLTYLRASDQRAKFDRSTTQAYLLQAIFGIACGSRELYLHSEITRCSLVTACRRLHLLKSATAPSFAPNGTLLTPEERHRAYIEEEEKRRLGWGIYLFDAQIAVLFNTPCLFAISELGGAHLPGDDELWNTTRTSSWLAIIEDQPDIEQPVFLHVLGSLLSDAKLQKPLNDFGSALIAHTLYRLCLDAYSLSRALLGGDASGGTMTSSALLLCFPPVLNLKPQVILDRLAVSWHDTSANPKALMVSTAALSHHSHIQFTRPGFLEHVRQAAGKYEPDPRRQPAREWLYDWSRREPEEARTIVVHAAQLNALLARFTFDTFSEVLWTLDCALALWGIIKLGPDLVEGGNFVAGRTTVKWSDNVDDIPWISRGGPVTFQSLGTLADMTVMGVLSFFINKLKNMPWGLTDLYVQVLERLLDEEVDGVSDPD